MTSKEISGNSYSGLSDSKLLGLMFTEADQLCKL